MSKTIKSYLSISIVLAILGLAIISDSKPVGPVVVEVYGQQQCKHLNAECFWNSSEHDCCTGLICEEWNVTGGTQRYKCGPASTPTPTTTPTSGPTITPTTTSTCRPTSTSTPTTTPTAGPTITPTTTSTPGPTITPTTTSTPGPTITPTTTSTPTPTRTEEMTGTPVPTATNTPSNNNDGSTTNNNGNPGSPVCNDADPGVPGNLRATALGGGKVRLNWNDSSGPHQSYAVAYGPNRDSFIYGDPNVGNVTSYVVSSLNPGGNYCFYVQAQNGCRGGNPSNIVCTNQAGGVRVLGTSDNYNPLVDGIKESYGGEVLGASTELMGTAEVTYSKDKLPSGNRLDLDHSIIIPKIGVNFPIYRPQQIGDMLMVGHREVLLTTIDDRKVYYGHNGSDVFGGLFQLRVGDQIKTIDEGIENKYEVTETRLVNKTEVESLKAESDQIVLVTCSFTKPEFRIIVKASIK